MRVCILNDNFYRGSGITKVIQRLLQTDSFKNIEVYVAGCASLKDAAMLVEETQLVPQSHSRTFGLMAKGPGLFGAMFVFARWLRSTQCDLLHVHHRRLAVLAFLLRPFTGVPVLFTGHLTFAPALWFRWFSPNAATGVSPSVVRYIQQCTRARDVSLIYNPYEFDVAGLDAAWNRPLRVLSVGRLEPVKAHESLIRAWARLKQDGINVELDIYGEGPLRTSLETLILTNGLQSNVRLRGFADNIPERMGDYAFNVLVSEREGFPNSVVEAASKALPTLVTDVDGSRDTLPSELCLPNALPFGDAEALYQALRRWLANPLMIRQDGIRFFESLQKVCDPETIGHQYVTLYRRLASRRVPD